MLNGRGLGLFVAFAMAAASACGTEPPDSSHIGTYHLETINGQPLPQPRTPTTENIAGMVILRADRTFTDSTAIRTLSTGDESEIMGIGVYRRDGDAVEFIPLAGDHTYIMTYSKAAGTLTQQFSPTSVWVYRRD